MPSPASEASKASRVSSGRWALFSSLLVTNTSARSRPDFAIASPTSSSLPYISAVSMCRYPASRALVTAVTVSALSIGNTPKPSCGMDRPLFSVICGTAVKTETLLRRRERDLATLCPCPRGATSRIQPPAPLSDPISQLLTINNMKGRMIEHREGVGVSSESVQVDEGDNGAGGPEHVLSGPHWRRRVDCGQRLAPWELVHLPSGRVVADESYCYRLTVTGRTDSGFHGGPGRLSQVRPLVSAVEHHG